MRAGPAAVAVGLGLGLLLIACAVDVPHNASAAAAWSCGAPDRRIVVHTAGGRLLLCDWRVLAGSFPVHLGRGGVGKTRQGDNKVPLGVYPLGVPRPSDRFGTFIPVGYPTPAERKLGYTGSDVGVHGPHRALRWLGPLTNAVSSTAGCIGLGSDRDIDQVAAWVNARSVNTIEIR
jgi:hypothetical protein